MSFLCDKKKKEKKWTKLSWLEFVGQKAVQSSKTLIDSVKQIAGQYLLEAILFVWIGSQRLTECIYASIKSSL